MRFCALFLCWLVVAASTAGLSAQPRLVFDAATRGVLLAEEAGRPWHPASLTKLMSAYVAFHAIREGELHLDTEVTVSADAANEAPGKSGLKEGAVVSMDTALKLMLVKSANDMAITVAEGVAGSLPAFIDRMNAQARRLGMTASRFVNPHGLPDPRQVTSARDMGLLAAALIDEFPQYRHLFRLRSVKIGKRTFGATNALFFKHMTSGDGMKTGFICASGHNLVASATEDGRRLVAVVMGARSSAQRALQTIELLRANFAKARQTGTQERPKLAVIANRSGRPADLRQRLCRNSVRTVMTEQLEGWGVTLGHFRNHLEAQRVLDAAILSQPGLFKAGRSGIIRVPGTRHFMPVMVDVSQSSGENFCRRLAAQGQVCEVAPPKTLAYLRERIIAEELARQQKSQGARSGKTRTRKRRQIRRKPARTGRITIRKRGREARAATGRGLQPPKPRPRAAGR